MVFCREQELSHCPGEEEGFDLLTIRCADVTGLSLLVWQLQGADLDFMHMYAKWALKKGNLGDTLVDKCCKEILVAGKCLL